MISVLGDYIEDIYIFGKVDRISPESPNVIFENIRTAVKEGGAGNVYNNLAALGESAQLFCSKNSKKTRYVCDNYIMFRADEEIYEINEKTDFDINSQYVILSDYNKGFLHHSQKIIDNLLKRNCKIIVDPKKNLDHYQNASIIKLNEKELKLYGNGYTPNQLRTKYNIETIVTTLANKGVHICSSEYEGNIETEVHQVADVTGAGDVFIASLTYYLNKGCTILESCQKATRLASISVTKFGTYVLTKEDILKNNIVFTNGCFDILHKGHVDYLKKSKQLGYKLIVGLNSDESVKKLKGSSRPVNNQNDRKTVLESLDCVDEVIIFEEETPINLIKQIKPDIITKGGDYEKHEVVGNELAEVIIIPFLKNYSTTRILEKL